MKSLISFSGSDRPYVIQKELVGSSRRTPTDGKFAKKCPLSSPSVTPTWGGGGAARLLILLLFSQGTQKPYYSQAFLGKFGQVMKSLKNIFRFRSTCVYTKTTCGDLENDADQWQICQKMALVLIKRNLELGGGGGVLPDFFIYSCFMCPVQQTTRI